MMFLAIKSTALHGKNRSETVGICDRKRYCTSLLLTFTKTPDIFDNYFPVSRVVERGKDIILGHWGIRKGQKWGLAY